MKDEMRRTARKGFALLAALMCAAAGIIGRPAAAEALPPEGAAPYPPVMSALGEDGLSYDDGTLKVKIEKGRENETNIYWVEVSVTDP